MDDFNDSESGFINEPDKEFGVTTGLTDVEILRISRINVIARGRRFGRRWLLKALRPELRESPSYRRQLQKEFEIHSRLHNPAVVQAVSFEEVEGLGMCIVEEWIEGKNLHNLLQEGKLSKGDRRRIMREIILAVGYLHAHGVIHRDLKPSNVMIRNAGQGVVLIDFGLADTDDYVELKQAAGTPGFISPEQENEQHASITDDIYSLGVIMKELSPEYVGIATRCTGPLNKRPKDTTALLDMIQRKDRAPKIFGISFAIMLFISLAIIAGIRIHSLSRSAREAEKFISAAQTAADNAQERVSELSETNRRHASQVAQLTDSLHMVKERMNKAEMELEAAEQYTKMREQAYQEGCKMIDKELQRFDKKSFPIIKASPTTFGDSLKILTQRLKSISDSSAGMNKYPIFSLTDRKKIREDIYYYALCEFTPYNDKWLKEIYPSYN
ncbi:MAG: serine/threonine protein kinase [Bacteroidales bacterium]|nr:serine/threonine protein kinase [Bacteroidales bacterium]